MSWNQFLFSYLLEMSGSKKSTREQLNDMIQQCQEFRILPDVQHSMSILSAKKPLRPSGVPNVSGHDVGSAQDVMSGHDFGSGQDVMSGHDANHSQNHSIRPNGVPNVSGHGVGSAQDFGSGHDFRSGHNVRSGHDANHSQNQHQLHSQFETDVIYFPPWFRMNCSPNPMTFQRTSKLLYKS